MRRIAAVALIATIVLGTPATGAVAAPSIKPGSLVARISGPGTGLVDEPVTLSLARSSVPKTAHVSSWSISFGDGSAIAHKMVEPRSVSHDYAVPGSYVVTLTLTDTQHKTSRGSTRILVSAPAPAAACTTTSSGSCIRGGEYCPVASEGTTGVDASGDRYVCTDSDNDGHPHWENP